MLIFFQKKCIIRWCQNRCNVLDKHKCHYTLNVSNCLQIELWFLKHTRRYINQTINLKRTIFQLHITWILYIMQNRDPLHLKCDVLTRSRTEVRTLFLHHKKLHTVSNEWKCLLKNTFSSLQCQNISVDVLLCSTDIICNWQDLIILYVEFPFSPFNFYFGISAKKYAPYRSEFV